MILLPAVDIKGGKCVRLLRGDYSTAEQVADDAVKTTEAFRKAGAGWIHIVDLDGAKAGKPVNSSLIFEMIKKSGLKAEVGGGIRTSETVEFYLKNGVSRVVLGTAAVKNPQIVSEAVKMYGREHIAVGIDARDGFAAENGWTETSSESYLRLAEKMKHAGTGYIVFTDIGRDGTLGGPNFQMIGSIAEKSGCNIIASGGISSIEDIKRLISMDIYGAVCGKAIYSGDVDLKSAIALCGGGGGNA